MYASTPGGTRPSMVSRGLGPSCPAAFLRHMLVRLRISVEERLPSMKVMFSMDSHERRGPNFFRPVGSSFVLSTSQPGRLRTKNSNSWIILCPVMIVFCSLGIPGFQSGLSESHCLISVLGWSQSEPMTKMNSESGCLSRRLHSRSYVNAASGRKHSASLTLIGNLAEKAVLMAIWHMQYLSMPGVLSFGLSGRAPHGTSQTSSALLLCTISDAQVRCEFVIGSKAPPRMAMRFLGLLAPSHDSHLVGAAAFRGAPTSWAAMPVTAAAPRPSARGDGPQRAATAALQATPVGAGSGRPRRPAEPRRLGVRRATQERRHMAATRAPGNREAREAGAGGLAELCLPAR
mmetsp:Transcript_9297/g.26127  ORF Transcript_9297/g.26127 Transcript_9297/m.26127 type:complete len:346 (+) Transcript_9297:129-1166(+)